MSTSFLPQVEIIFSQNYSGVFTSSTSCKCCYFDLSTLSDLHSEKNYLHFAASGEGKHDTYYTTAAPLALAVLLLLSLAEDQVFILKYVRCSYVTIIVFVICKTYLSYNA